MNHLELDRNEKLQAAVHEAAHAVVSQALGCPCRATVFRNDDGNHDVGGIKLWGGQATHIGKLHPRDYPIYSAAGMAGEFLHSDPDVCGMQIMDAIEWEVVELSETDECGIRGIGTGRVTYLEDAEPMFDAAIEVLRENRVTWLWAIGELVDSDVVTEDALRDRFNSDASGKSAAALLPPPIDDGIQCPP